MQQNFEKTQNVEFTMSQPEHGLKITILLLL